MGLDLDLVYRARVRAFVCRRNKNSGSYLMTPSSKKYRNRHCTGTDENLYLAHRNTSGSYPYFNGSSYVACALRAGQTSTLRTLLQKYRWDQLLAMVEGLVPYVTGMGQMLLLKSGDIEENPGPSTQRGELGAPCQLIANL